MSRSCQKTLFAPHVGTGSRVVPILAVAAAFLLVSACRDAPTSSTGPGGGNGGGGAFCSVPEDQLFDGGPGKDGIPSLDDPLLAGVGEAGAAYLRPEDRVIGVALGGEAIAFPHRLGWWHEILNVDVGGVPVAITFCPLTGSGLAFDRSVVDGAEFGVSGLLFQTNLIMYDRRSEESLWFQMARGARCGVEAGTPLDMAPSMDVTWEAWSELHPNTRVPAHAPEVGQRFDGYRYPYWTGANVRYDEEDNPSLMFPVNAPVDQTRPPKELVLGIPRGQTAGLAFPFGILDELGELGVAPSAVDGASVAVFWSREAQGAAAYFTRLNDRELTFAVQDGAFVDEETGSVWSLGGAASSGELEGEHLEPVPEAYVAFWFAWAAFQPNTSIWAPDR